MSKGFPNHWEILAFSDAVKDSASGQPKIQKGKYSPRGSIPVIDQGQEMIGGYTDDLSMIAGVEIPAIIFGDHTRIFKFVETEFCLGADGAKILEPKVGLDKKFLYHYLRQLRIESAGYSRHFKFLKEMHVPVPPLEEQKRIAAILDKADEIRKKRQQAIELADQFLKSVFLDMFGDPVMNPKGWQRAKFEELIDSVTYGLTVRPNYVDEGFPLISAREIRTGQIDFSSAPRISEDDFEKLSQKAKPSTGDILFSKTGSIGHSALVEDGVKFAVTQNAARITPCPEKCTPVFLLSLLRTKFFKDLANREAKGNAVKDLQLGVMKNFNLYLPPIALQRAFSAVYRQHMQHAMKQQESSKSIESLVNGLSLQAFSGKLSESKDT